jgi:hypothetical protein
VSQGVGANTESEETSMKYFTDKVLNNMSKARTYKKLTNFKGIHKTRNPSFGGDTTNATSKPRIDRLHRNTSSVDFNNLKTKGEQYASQFMINRSSLDQAQ